MESKARARGRAVLALAARVTVTVAVTLAVVAITAAAIGAHPAKVVASLVSGAFGDRAAWVQTLRLTTPILFTGLAVAWAFRAGLFNIGAEGQLLWGALAAAWAGSALRLPALLHIPVALAAGAAAGALWAWPAALLKTRRGTPEVVATLLLNWLAVHLTTFVANYPLHDPTQQGARTRDILSSAQLPLIPGTRLHAGLLLALACAVLLGVVLAQTRFGFQMRVVEKNPEAARAAGIRVERIWTLALLQSGALAGLAGAVEVLGVHYYFAARFSPGYGYDGIVVAILGANNPAGIAAAALFWGGLANAAVNMEMDLGLATGASRSLITIIQALVVLAVAVRRWPFGDVARTVWKGPRVARTRQAGEPTSAPD